MMQTKGYAAQSPTNELTPWCKSVVGSSIGGIAETQEMLDFAATCATVSSSLQRPFK